MQNFADKVGAMIETRFSLIMQYVKEHCLSEEEMKALLGSRLNLSKVHCLQGYFGPKTIHSAAQLLNTKGLFILL